MPQYAQHTRAQHTVRHYCANSVVRNHRTFFERYLLAAESPSCQWLHAEDEPTMSKRYCLSTAKVHRHGLKS